MTASWQHWHGHLRQWRELADGSLELVGVCSELWRTRLSWQFDPPCIMFLEGLHERGWAAGAVAGRQHDCPALAAGETAKVFEMPADAVKGKAYFACLILVARLAARGMQCLPVGQPPAYYMAVSVAELPAGCPVPRPLGSRRAPPQHKRQKAQSADHDDGAPDSSSASGGADGTWEEPAPHGGSESDQGPGAADEGHAGTAPNSGAASSSGPVGAPGQAGAWMPGVEASTGGPAVPSPPLAPAGGPAQRAARGNPSGRVETFAGNDVFKAVMPRADGYHPLYVMCPLAHGGHGGGLAPCMKHRGTGERQCRRLGQREPFAYLAAWASAALDFPDRDTHVSWNPPPAAVRTVLEGSSGDVA